MLQFEPKNSTLKHLKQAMAACKAEGTEGPFKNDRLTLVGSYYETPFLPGTILSEPSVNVRGLNNDTDELAFTVTLKPIPTELPKVEQLEKFLQVTNMGYIFDKPDTMPELAAGMTKAQAFMAQNSMMSEVQNYDLVITMSSPVVTRVDTVINGVRYWQYKITDTLTESGADIYSHSVYLLFKERKSDGENFYSGLVNQTLNKRDSKKVLDIISDLNITGLFIGGLVTQYEKEDLRAVKTSLYSIGTEMELKNMENLYIIKSAIGTVGIDKDRIEYVRVERVGDYKYKVRIQTTKEETTLFIG